MQNNHVKYLAKEVAIMETNMTIDENLINEAFNIGGYSTKEETVTIALEEFIANRKKQSLIHILGSIDYDKDYNHKEGRFRK